MLGIKTLINEERKLSCQTSIITFTALTQDDKNKVYNGFIMKGRYVKCI